MYQVILGSRGANEHTTERTVHRLQSAFGCFLGREHTPRAKAAVFAVIHVVLRVYRTWAVVMAKRQTGAA